MKPEDIQIGETYRVHIPRRDNPSRHLTSDQARPDVDIALIQLYIAGDNDFALTVTGVAERLRDEPAVTGVRVVDTSHVRVPLAPEVAQARGLPPGVDYLVDGSLLDARTGDFVELTTDQTLTVPLRWLRPHA